MLRIAGQTAGPIGLKLFVDTHGYPFVDTHGYPGGDIRQKKYVSFFQFLFSFSFQFFSPRATPGPSASYYYYTNSG